MQEIIQIIHIAALRKEIRPAPQTPAAPRSLILHSMKGAAPFYSGAKMCYNVRNEEKGGGSGGHG